MPLHGGDRHDPVVRIVEMSAGLLGLHFAGALHQQTRDDLEAVGDPVLHFLQKDRLLANEFVFLQGLGAGERDVGYRDQQPDAFMIPVFEQMRVHQ